MQLGMQYASEELWRLPPYLGVDEHRAARRYIIPLFEGATVFAKVLLLSTAMSKMITKLRLYANAPQILGQAVTLHSQPFLIAATKVISTIQFPIAR